LNQPVPVDGKRFQRIAWAVVLLVLAQLCWLQLRPESASRRFCATIMESPAQRTAKVEQEPSDRIARQVGNGNALLKLAGYARTNPAVANSLGYFYFRMSYLLYPRQLFAAPAGQVINDGNDIMRIGFSPGPQWLQQHDVRSVLIFGNNFPGEETPRWEPLPPQDSHNATQPAGIGGK